MDLELKGKRAIVCAASKGLGKAAAEALIKEGAKVIICARNEEELKKTAMEIGARYVVADITKDSEREKIIKSALTILGGIDILVNNSGGPPVGNFESFGPEDWREAFELNFLSFVHMTSMAIDEMKENGWGRIINLASYAALEAIPGLILSHGIRPSVITWTRAIAREVGKFGIGVVAICPGLFYTDRVKQILKVRSEKEGKTADEILKEWVSDVPMGRMGDPAELGDLVAFLASPKSSFITGSAIVIDGGIMKRLI